MESGVPPVEKERRTRPVDVGAIGGAATLFDQERCKPGEHIGCERP